MKLSKYVVALLTISCASGAFAAGKGKPVTPLLAMDTAFIAAGQRWMNGAEIMCPAPKEDLGAYQLRFTQRMQEVGQLGWELVTVAPAPSWGNHCLIFAYKQLDKSED